MPNPFAAECGLLRSQTIHESRSGCWYPGELQFIRSECCWKGLTSSCPEISNLCSSAFCLDGGTPGRRIYSVWFPTGHRRSILTTKSLEHVNKEIKRRTRVVGIFPNEPSCLRLVTVLLMETSEEWQIGKRCCFTISGECWRTVDISNSNSQKMGCVIVPLRILTLLVTLALFVFGGPVRFLWHYNTIFSTWFIYWTDSRNPFLAFSIFGKLYFWLMESGSNGWHTLY